MMTERDEIPIVMESNVDASTTTTQRILLRRARSVKGPKILQKVEKEEASDEEHSDSSDDLEVFETEENETYQNKLLTGKLRRLGFRSSMWRSKFGAFAVMLSFLLSFDTLIKFVICFDRFGISFLIVFGICMFTVGFPLMYIELALGQYTSSNVFSILGRMAPGLGGVGMVAIMHNLWYILTTQNSFHFFINICAEAINIFSSDTLWHSCSHSMNSPNCRHLLQENPCADTTDKGYVKVKNVQFGDLCVDGSSNFAPQEDTVAVTFARKIEQDATFSLLSSEGYDMATMTSRWYPSSQFLMSIVVTSFMVYLFLRKSHKFTLWLSVITLVIALSSVVIFMVIFIYMQPPPFPYIGAFTKESSMWQMVLWTESTFLVLRILKIGQGGLIFMGSQNSFHNNFITDTFLYCFGIFGFYVFYAIHHLLVVDSAVLKFYGGDMEEMNKNFDVWNENDSANNKLLSGNVAYHITFFIMAMKQFGSYEAVTTLYFALLAILQTTTTVIIRYEIVLSMIAEHWPRLDTRMNREFALNAAILILTLFNFILASEKTFYIVSGVESIAFPVLASFVALFQLFIVFICYGPTRIYANITYMMNRSKADGFQVYINKIVNAILLLLWLVVIPASIGISLIYFMSVKNFLMKETPAFIIGAILLPLGIVPIYFLRKAIDKRRANGSLWELFKVNTELWGPRTTRDRTEAERIEREIRSLW